MESVQLSFHEESALRVEIYSLLAHLLRQVPEQPVLDWLAELEMDQSSSTMAAAWQVLKLAAKTTSALAVEDEYQELFIGIGRGEIVPYCSWYLTGSLMEMPLAHLRRDLAQLGFQRTESTKEPEDHIAALLEVMAMLVEGGDPHLQRSFFNRHIAVWFERLFTDMKAAKSAVFYSAVAELALQYLLVEKTRLIEVN